MLKNKFRPKLLALTALAATLIAVGGVASPALAFSSKSNNNSPSGCSGGFSASSSKDSSGALYVSIGRYGSTCGGQATGNSTVHAAYLYGNGTYIVQCQQTTQFCSHGGDKYPNVVGGYHYWDYQHQSNVVSIQT